MIQLALIVVILDRKELPSRVSVDFGETDANLGAKIDDNNELASLRRVVPSDAKLLISFLESNPAASKILLAFKVKAIWGINLTTAIK